MIQVKAVRADEIVLGLGPYSRSIIHGNEADWRAGYERHVITLTVDCR